MALVMRQVFSSRVDQIGYDDEKQQLHVIWKDSGKESIYSGVDPVKADTVMNSWSVGKALNELVIGNHGHGYAG